MDTFKIAPGLYKFTAIDGCTPYQIIEIYPEWIFANTILFLKKIIEEMHLPI